MTIQQARIQGEAIANYKLDEATFQQVLRYTYRKARLTGHSPQYAPLLLVDEIKNYANRQRSYKQHLDYVQLCQQLTRQANTQDHQYQPAHAKKPTSKALEYLKMTLVTIFFYTAAIAIWWIA